MSRKTKAELLAENAFLRKVINALHDKVERLERSLEICDGNRRLFLELLDEQEKEIKTNNKADSANIKRSLDYRNKADRLICGYQQGPVGSKKKAKKRKAYIVARYNYWLEEGKRYDIARELANKDLQKNKELDFKKGYGTTKLCEFCPRPKGQ